MFCVWCVNSEGDNEEAGGILGRWREMRSARVCVAPASILIRKRREGPFIVTQSTARTAYLILEAGQFWCIICVDGQQRMIAPCRGWTRCIGQRGGLRGEKTKRTKRLF